MSKTISSSTTGPVILGTADNPLYITSTGTVTSSGSADGVDGGTGTTWTIANAGVVSASSSGNGVSLASSGIVGNTGSISGKDALVLHAGGSVTNDVGGSISGLGTLGSGLGSGAGVYITGAAGTVTNHSTISGVAYGVGLGHGGLVTNTSSILGGEDGVIIQGAIGTIANSGTIIATVDDGVALFAGGSVTNASSASITGRGTLGAGIFITGGTGTVTNAGSIAEPSHHGVLMAGGGSFSNAASGSISALVVGVFIQNQAGTLTNAGYITGTGADGTGVYLMNGGSATNTSTGTIVGHKFGAFLEGGFTTLANYGSISGTTYDGVVLGLGGMVTNAAGASISGAGVGVYVKYRAIGAVTNSGSINASATGGAGIDLADGGSVTNNSTGSVSGNWFGVFVTGAGGTVTNNGSIAGGKYDGVVLVKGGSVTNTSGASIKGGSVGVYVETGAPGTVINSGSINAANASGAGIDLASGGSVTNNSGGSISGGGFGVFTTGAFGTLTNSGSISGSHGVGLEAGGSVTNAASASISGQVAGVFAQGGAATLSNAGNISATAGVGADIEGGGSITNLAGATISGSAFGIFLSGGSGTVTNAGTISGGSYAIDFAGSATNRLVVDPGAVFVGRVIGGSGTNTLELASGTGTIGGVGTGSFNNFQVLAVDAGATWTLNGANTAPSVLDNGTISIAGSLDVSTALDPSSTGLFQVGSGATLEVAAATGTQTQINFQGSTSELIIDNAASFGTNVGIASYAGPQLQHFVAGDKIDLKNYSSGGVTFNYNASTGVLQVSNSANQLASLDFQTASLGSPAFQATGDGATGIFITTAPSATPSVSSIVTSGTGITNGNGDLNASKAVTLTVNFSAPVTVNTAGGSPTLALNDSGTAAYTGGSGTSALTFSYTVTAGQNTPDLVVSSFTLNGATVRDAAANNANLSGATNYNPAGILQIDTTTPVVAITSAGGLVNQATQTVTGTVTDADGGTAGTTVTVFDGTTQVGTAAVQADGSWSTSVTLTNGTNTLTAQDADPAGNTGVSSPVTYTLNTTAPTVSSIVTSGTGITNGNGDLNASKAVTLTVNFSTPVTVNTAGGSPTLALNDSGTAAYVGGSGTSALTFSYTVTAGQNTPDLVVSSFTLNGATVRDAATNNADLSGATNYNPAGILQIDTTTPVVAITSAGGLVNQATQTVTGTVTDADGGTAGTTVTVFDGTTQVGTATVQANGSWSTSVSLTNGTNTLTAQDADPAGNTGVSSPVTYTLNTTPPTVSSIVTSGTGITNGNGDLNASKAVTLTVNFSTPVTVNTAGGSPTLALNDSGTAAYVGGSGTSALTFSYTVTAGQNTPDLVVSSFTLNGATVRDAATNNADLSGATNYNPAGILQIDTTTPVVAITSAGGLVNQATQTVTGTVTDADGGTAGTTVTVFDGTTQVGTATVQANGSWSTSVSLTNGTNTLTAQDADPAGNTGVSSPVTYTLNTTPPTVSSIVTSGTGITNGNGDLNASKAVTLTVNFSAPVTVNTAGGSPTLALNDSGIAAYVGGSGTSALTFSYTVAAGQNTPDLVVSSFTLNGATIQDAATNNADLSGATNYNPAGILQIDTTTPVVAITSAGGLVNQATQTVTGTVTDADGGTAGTTVTVFDGTTQVGTAAVQANGSWSTSVTLTNGTNTLTAQDADPAGNTGVSSPVTYTLNTTGPTVGSIVTSGTGITNGNGDLNASKAVTLTVNFSAPVTVNTAGGSPTLALNDSGIAAYVGGSGTSALTFSYTVAAGQNTPDLVVSSFTLNGATIQDAATNNADLSGATNYNPAGILQIDTTTPVVAITSAGGLVNQATQTVTGTVTDADGGTAGTTVTVFDGTTQVGTAAVQANGSWSTSVTLTNGTNTLTAQDADPAGNTGVSSPVTYTLNTTAPTVSSIVTSGTGITNGNGDLNASKAVTLTVNFSTPVTVNTAGGSPTLALNDSGTAAYVGGSGTSALTFSYTVAAGQNTPDLVVSSFTLNGATIQDAATNNADLSGATNYNPAGILQIDTTTPVVAITSAGGLVNQATQTVTGTVTDADGGTAGTTVTVFDGTTQVGTAAVQANGSWSTSVSLTNGTNTLTAQDADPAGNTGVSSPVTYTLNTTGPTVGSIVTSGTGITNGNGDLNASKAVTLTVNFSAPVTVNTAGGSPTLALNDSGIAAYVGGSGTSALTFSYTVAAGQNTPDLVVSSFTLNGATIQDAATNNADLSGATNYNPAGILQIDTTTPVVAITSAGGLVNQATQTVTGTVTDADGGTAGTTVTVFDGTTQVGTAAVQADGSWSTSVTLTNGTNTLTAQDADPAGNTGVSSPVTYTLNTTGPTVGSIVTSGTGITNGNGDLNASKAVTLTVNFSAPVTVNTAGGSPTLALNDSGIAAYVGGSGTSALTFSYTVAAGQNTPDLVVSSFTLNGATIQDAATNNADLSGATNYNPAGILQIDTTTPVVAITSAGGLVNQATQTVTGTVTDADGGTAGTTVTVFDGTTQVGTAAVQADGSWSTSVTLTNGTNTLTAQDADPAGNTGVSSPVTYTLNTTGPTVGSIVTSGTGITNGNGDLNASKAVTLTVNFSAPVTVNTAGGSPTLALNDSGIAAYVGGSGTSALTFSYTVAAGQNTPDLVVSSFTLNGATIQDAATNNADLSGATNYNPAGILQIDTTTPVVAITSAGGLVNQATQTVTGTVTDADGGTAGTTVTVFDGTTQVGTAAVQADGSWSTSVTLTNGTNTLTAQDADPAGNTGVSSPVTYTLNTTGPTVGSIVTSGTGITNGNGDLNASKAVTLTVNFSAPVTVNTAGGSPTLALNDSGIAAYVGGSGTSALTFSYTVAAGQNTPDLVVSSFTLNGATIQDAATNNADLSGATNYNPAGILQIDTTTPTIAINTIASNNIINAAKASTGFTISGTATDAENGQAVTVNILNSANSVVDSYTTTDQNNAWSVRVTSAQATALVDGSYTVTANVADKAGNPSPQASHALTVDEEKVAEPPTLAIANTSLTVLAGGSVSLGITATPVDPDDRVSVKINGVPSYERITAPSGDTVSRQLQLNGTYNWTITESVSTAGKPLTGLTLSSSYRGTGHPVASLTVTASNTTSGETATSASQALIMTDPPAATEGGSPSSTTTSQGTAGFSNPAPYNQLVALFDQFVAAGFDNDRAEAGQMTSLPHLQSALEELAFLSRPHHAA